MNAIYLDNAATSFPKAPGVSEAVRGYIDGIGANVGRGVYASAALAGRTVLQTRWALCALFHYTGPATHAVLTPGVTFSLNLVLRGFVQPGDHVLVSSLEHNAVMRPLMALAAKSGVEFSRIPADRDGVTRPEDIAPCLRKNTRLVLVSHASNVCGTLFPLAECAALCREKGIPLAVDAAQTAGHVPIDFDRLRLSALCVPGHKGLLGPQGVGAVLLSPDFAKKLSPLTTGGTGSFSDLESQPYCMPDKFEAGTPNLPGIFGLRAALEYVVSRGVPELRAHELELTERFLTGISDLPVRLAGTADLKSRVGVVSLDFPSRDNAEVSSRLEQEFGILTRCGLQCSPGAHKTLGTFPQGTVRFSVGYTTTEKDIDAAVSAVRKIAKE